MNASRPTVFIVDNDDPTRRNSEAVVQQAGLPAKAFTCAQDFLNHYEHGRPGCVPLDIQLPDMSGLEVQQALIEQGATIPVIFVTGIGQIPVVVQAMRSGAFDYLLKPSAPNTLLDRVLRAIDTDATTRASQPPLDLTQRERQILRLMASGLSSKQTAVRLRLSNSMVEIHRSRLTQKLGTRNRAHLIRLAMQLGLHPRRVPPSRLSATLR